MRKSERKEAREWKLKKDREKGIGGKRRQGKGR